LRRIINSTFVSLDGVIEHLERWHFEYHDDESRAIAAELVSGADALLMGRRTYEGFAEAWPSRAGDPLADKMNGMRKYVASTTLKTAEWSNSTIIEGDLVEAVAEIKRQPGQDIVMYGYGPVAQALLQHDLLDEIQLWVHPVFVGLGEREGTLIREGNSAKLKLLDNRTIGSGIVILTYQPEVVS
jgi:dihydrofolate reductase